MKIDCAGATKAVGHSGPIMQRLSKVLSLLALVLGVVAANAVAQGPAAAPSVESASDWGVLRGRWVRPDGGYTISIRSVGADGRLDAAYANPSPLPFSKAVATRDGKTIKVFLELRAGGYDGSTYTLSYDPARDALVGVYYQAVAKQKFDVAFARAK